jgi:hypothetical protein
LNVVRFAQGDERTPAVSLNVLNTRVRHPQRVKAVCPRFKSGEVAHTKRHMVEPDLPLVEGRGIALGMRHSCDNQTATREQLGAVIVMVGTIGRSGFLRTGNGRSFRSVGFPRGREL